MEKNDATGRNTDGDRLILVARCTPAKKALQDASLSRLIHLVDRLGAFFSDFLHELSAGDRGESIKRSQPGVVRPTGCAAQSRERNAARSSPTKTSGTSHAAK